MYIGKQGDRWKKRAKEHDRDIRPVRTQISAVSKHDNKTGDLPFSSGKSLRLLIETLADTLVGSKRPST